MKNSSNPVVFFGSGPVAASSLELLVKWCPIEAVITKPKPAHHKGLFPVIEVGHKLDLKIYEVQNSKELAQLFENEKFNSLVGLVIDYGVIIPKNIIDKFPLGIVNSHFSLLPELRGADPISYAILEGKNKTGVSLMNIDQGLDTGKLLTYRGIPIDKDETSQTLTRKLIKLSDDLLIEHLPNYISGDLKPKNQPHPDRATYSSKITKQAGFIDWNQPAEIIERQIRAFIEWPKSHAKLGNNEVTITKAHVIQKQGRASDISAEDNKIVVYCERDALEIEKLKPAGRNEMTAREFLLGYKL